MNEIIVVILAAGASTRMGQIKQLLPHRGVTLLQNAVDAATSLPHSVGANALTVLGANAAEILAATSFGSCALIINDQWQSGLSSSVQCALNYVEKNFPQCRGIILSLADQPHVTSARLAEIIARAEETNLPIVVSSFSHGQSEEKIPGPPAYFARQIFSELRQLSGDNGARNVVLADVQRVASIDFPLAAVDIDSQSDYDQLSLT